TVALRFLTLGFWLLSFTVVITILESGRSDMIVLLASYRLATKLAPSSPFAGVLGAIQRSLPEVGIVFSVLSSLLNKAGVLLLAYGAIRVRGTRRPARGGEGLGADLVEFRRTIQPGLRWLRHWLLEDPGLDRSDEGRRV